MCMIIILEITLMIDEKLFFVIITCLHSYIYLLNRFFLAMFIFVNACIVYSNVKHYFQRVNSSICQFVMIVT